MNNSRVHILLIGGAGRMGRAISDLAMGDSEIDVVGECDLGDPIEAAMKNCDVAIDFSNPDAICDICAAASQHRKPLVIGTTGYSEDQRGVIKETARSLPVVISIARSL